MQYEIKGGAFPVVICQLNDGEQMITEKGSMVWMSPNMEMKTSGGEGFFNTVLTGPGKIWLQTMPISGVAMSIYPFLPTKGNG